MNVLYQYQYRFQFYGQCIFVRNFIKTSSHFNIIPQTYFTTKKVFVTVTINYHAYKKQMLCLFLLIYFVNSSTCKENSRKLRNLFNSFYLISKNIMVYMPTYIIIRYY